MFTSVLEKTGVCRQQTLGNPRFVRHLTTSFISMKNYGGPRIEP